MMQFVPDLAPEWAWAREAVGVLECFSAILVPQMSDNKGGDDTDFVKAANILRHFHSLESVEALSACMPPSNVIVRGRDNFLAYIKDVETHFPRIAEARGLVQATLHTHAATFAKQLKPQSGQSAADWVLFPEPRAADLADLAKLESDWNKEKFQESFLLLNQNGVCFAS